MPHELGQPEAEILISKLFNPSPPLGQDPHQIPLVLSGVAGQQQVALDLGQWRHTLPPEDGNGGAILPVHPLPRFGADGQRVQRIDSGTVIT